MSTQTQALAAPVSPKNSIARMLRIGITLNGKFAPREKSLVRIAWLVLILGSWTFVHITYFPNPASTWEAAKHMWLIEGLGQEFYASLMLYFQSMAMGTLIAGTLALATRFPVLEPPITWLTLTRFMPVPTIVLFTLIYLGSGPESKFVVMTAFQCIMLLKPLLDTIEKTDKGKYAHARTIYRSEWLVTYEVLILGRAGDFLKDFETNQPMGWTMLFVVEGISISGGGLGALMQKMMKHPMMNEVTAMAILCIGTGYFLKMLSSWTRKRLTPAADFKAAL